MTSGRATTGSTTFLIVLVALAFGLRAATVAWLSDTVPYTDFALYHVAGAEIARDPGFLFDAEVARTLPQLNWWPPGYPTFLGVIYTIFGADHRVAVWLHVVLGVLACVFVYLGTSRIFDAPVARLAAILVAINPTFILLTNQLASENVFVFWLSLALWWASRLRRHATDSGSTQVANVGRDACILGLFLGLSALTRAVGVVVALVAILGLWRQRRAMRAVSCAWMLAGLAIVVLPWSVRNAVVVGRPALLSFGGGINFYFGHNDAHIGFQDLASSPLGSIRDPAELDVQGYKKGFAFIVSHPLQDALHAIQKIGALYAFPDYALHVNSGILVPDVLAHPERAAEAQARLRRQKARDRWLNGPLKLVARAYHVLLVAAAALALTRWRGLPGPVRLFAWLVVAWTCVHVVYWAQPRFRAPSEIFLVVLAATAWTALARAMFGRTHAPHRPTSHSA